jgi:hypothetical protein
MMRASQTGAYWERVLNGLVYELYFPEELHLSACGHAQAGAAGLRLFDLVAQANLPDFTHLPEKDRLPRLRQKFEELHDLSACGHAQAGGAHPLRIALDKLAFLDPIRIIEGKA